ncbi:dienelactone hydrolase family protein [Xanthobacter pseudotagetidis]|uniref:dienelactone hydrolase family protein n=1 Tax=Xanthobacter pseudotagetidis TaxID=3119911 RepID=UPI003727C814
MATFEVSVPPHGLPGTLSIPDYAGALVLFAHGSGSSRHSPRNATVAGALNAQGIATLLFDLLTPEEEADRANVFDIDMLADRLSEAVRWARAEPRAARLPIGLFGASTGAAAALRTAARLGGLVSAVVSRGGRPDLAWEQLGQVAAPTLLIVGGADETVLELNAEAFGRLTCDKALKIVPDASHLFPEPGALEEVIALSTRWFERHLLGRTDDWKAP